MANKITLTANDGSIVEFYDEIKAQGGVKDVYFSPDKTYVVAFYRKPINANDRERITNIVGIYRQRIFDTPEGNYWKNLFAWPTKMVEWNGKTGIIMPFYDKRFFFSSGPFKGKEKEGKWFASAKLRNKFLPADQKGNWLTNLHMCIKIARAVRRLHAAGLAHSDLSYKNILVDPITGSACIIDDDSLVVPGKFPPEVIGTPDFIAPEVIETKHLALDDKQRKLPSIYTDRHALAVLIYMYLLNRHPLRGGKVNDVNDSGRDEELSMGAKALFIENPTDKSNRVKAQQLSPAELPQGDPAKMPYTICGPYLKKLFDRAFVEGLHDPSTRQAQCSAQAGRCARNANLRRAVGAAGEQPVPLLRMWGVKEKRYGLCFALFLAQEKWGNLFQNANALLAGKSCTVGAGADDRFTVFGNTDNIFNILIRFFAGRVSGNSGPFHRIDCMV